MDSQDAGSNSSLQDSGAKREARATVSASARLAENVIGRRRGPARDRAAHAAVGDPAGTWVSVRCSSYDHTLSSMPTVLQLLSQRPSLTGSGVTIDALAREATRRGWNQHVVVAHPTGEAPPVVDGLPDERIHPLGFGGERLPFAVPGMSEVMPYPSTVFSSMSDGDWERYRLAWREHVARVIDLVRPDVIHSHHVWLLSSLMDCLPSMMMPGPSASAIALRILATASGSTSMFKAN